MSKTRFQISVSLDGFVAGPNQSQDEPLGIGGEDLHQWVIPLAAWRRPQGLEGGEENASSAVLEEAHTGVGAHIMGRNMFGGGPGPWNEDDQWKGWWGDDPPYHSPVFVITNHPRDPLPMQGDTTFYFVTDGVESALRQAKDAAGDKDVFISGGAKVIQQFLAAGLVDEFELSIVPILLTDGERLLEDVGELKIEQVRAVEAPGVTHIKYRVVR